MVNLLSRQNALLTSAALFAAILILLLLLPPEQSLGHIIKVVYLHAALVQTSLLVFTTAAAAALVSFFKPNNFWAETVAATQKTGLIFWSVYLLSSTIVTYLAWGVWIAWEEPRVVISIIIWIATLLFFMLTVWIQNKKFTAVANISLAGISLYLTKTSGTIRHPLSPIAHSTSILFKIVYILVLLFTFLLALQLIRLLKISNKD